ncbi:MAG: hypothetical protein ACREQJ_16125 [Candidatus Binatia bacterium]
MRLASASALCSLSIGLLVSTGCAFGTRHVSLGEAVPISPVAGGGARGKVVVVKFADGRIGEDGAGATVGHVRNGWGMKTAEVKSSVDPVDWVTDTVARSLAAQGYQVERSATTLPMTPIPSVSGTVTKVSTDTIAMIEGSIGALVTVESGGQKHFSGMCQGTSSQVNWFAASSEYEGALTRAMTEFVADCTPKLSAVLSTLPAATVASAPPAPAPVSPAPAPVVLAAAPAPVAAAATPKLGRCELSTVRAMKRDGAMDSEIQLACQATLEATRTALQ